MHFISKSQKIGSTIYKNRYCPPAQAFLRYLTHWNRGFLFLLVTHTPDQKRLFSVHMLNFVNFQFGKKTIFLSHNLHEYQMTSFSSLKLLTHGCSVVVSVWRKHFEKISLKVSGGNTFKKNQFPLKCMGETLPKKLLFRLRLEWRRCPFERYCGIYCILCGTHDPREMSSIWIYQLRL